jgi:hypothetical protein
MDIFVEERCYDNLFTLGNLEGLSLYPCECQRFIELNTNQQSKYILRGFLEAGRISYFTEIFWDSLQHDFLWFI